MAKKNSLVRKALRRARALTRLERDIAKYSSEQRFMDKLGKALACREGLQAKGAGA